MSTTTTTTTAAAATFKAFNEPPDASQEIRQCPSRRHLASPDPQPQEQVKTAFDFEEQDPQHAFESHQHYNSERKNLFKLFTAAFSFFVAGVNDGSLGALIPHVIRDYKITTAVVSAVYAANFVGWLAAALSCTPLRVWIGKRSSDATSSRGWVMLLGCGLQVLGNGVRCGARGRNGNGIGFAGFVVSFGLTSWGQGLLDTEANGYVASLKTGGGGGGGGEGGEQKEKLNRWLGGIHAAYMAGCLVAPFAASGIAEVGKTKWYLFYFVPLGLGIVNLVMVAVAFWEDIAGVRFGISARRGLAQEARIGSGGADAATQEDKKSASALLKETLTTPSVWLLSLFFFFYLGTAVTAGGWVVEYLVDVRNGQLPQMGYVPAGFSGGCLLGRLFLPEITHRWGERRMIFIYCVLALGFQLLFWLVPNIIAASVAISFLGFFIGPFFATGISVGSKIFPAHISPTAISFVFVFAQTGGSLFPVITGILGSQVGVSALQPMLVGLIAATAVSWLFVPRAQHKQE